MPPRIWNKQLLFIPIAFITVWFCINFITFLSPANIIKENAPKSGHVQIIDDMQIDQIERSSKKPLQPNVIGNAESAGKNMVQNKADATAVRNLPQSAIKNNDSLSIKDIRRIIEKINSEQRVLNGERFTPSNSDEIVIVIQVHNRKTYLEYLIDSLRRANGISNALLIFSHDFFDEEINTLIQNIDFCRVLQIFYPLSMQLVPDIFPGADPKDCPENMPKEKAMAIACQNAYSPDSYGHYRKAKIVQLKHHWWWKTNTVFNLQILRNYNAPVIFLEEDLYVIEDFIPTMKLMHETAKAQCKSCKILSLASNQDATFTYRADFNRASRASVKSQFSNMGLAFTAETWREMQDCAHVFCRFDDYNWDISMQHVFTTCMKDTAAMTLLSPRLFHMGSCGTHHTAQNCDSTQKISEINQLVQRYKTFLYPKRLHLEFDLDHRRSDVYYGGWGDPRDQGLCIKHVLKI